MDGANAINIFRKTMRLMDVRLMDHGDRVAYVLYNMLKFDKYYKKTKLDKFVILGLLHDIGAYATNDIDDMLSFESKNIWDHSVYGYLYLKYLSPLESYADIILYHHLDYVDVKKLDCAMRELAAYLTIADRFDIALLNYGEFDKELFEKNVGTRFSPEGIELLYKAEEEFHLSRQIKNGAYKHEFDKIVDKITMTRDEINALLKLLVFSIDFRNVDTVYRTVTTNIVSVGLAHKFNIGNVEEDDLYYASLLYDIGMLSVPDEVLNTNKALSPEQRSLVNKHVLVSKECLDLNVSDGIMRMVVRHHEWMDGTGYPYRLKEEDYTVPEMVLQVSDIIGALSCRNERRGALNRQEIAQALTKEVFKGHLNAKTVLVFVCNMDEILDKVEETRNRALENYYKIKEQYPQIIKRFDKLKGQ